MNASSTPRAPESQNADSAPRPPLLSLDQPTESPSVSIVEVGQAADLMAHVPAWESLAQEAEEPNVFYEPWMILPALKEYGDRHRLTFLFAYQSDSRRPDAAPVLCGFFPLERRFGFKGVPISVIGLWKHLQCFLCTPLIRAGRTAACFDALLKWLAINPGRGSLLELACIAGDGPVHQALADWMLTRHRTPFVMESYTRAFLRRGPSGEAYLAAAVSSNRRKKVKRQEKKLGEIGQLKFTALKPGDDINVWIEDFLRLEAAGWKGRKHTALACVEPDRNFFETVAREAFRRGRLRMLTLQLDGRPIAQLCDFIAGDGVFSFKIAFDEAYAEFSPGVLLDVENLRQFHDAPGLAWADSCNAPGPSGLQDLWSERLPIHTMILSTGTMTGNLFLAGAPGLRKLMRALRSVFGRRGVVKPMLPEPPVDDDSTIHFN